MVARPVGTSPGRLARKLAGADLGQVDEKSGVHECLLLLCTQSLYQKLYIKLYLKPFEAQLNFTSDGQSQKR